MDFVAALEQQIHRTGGGAGGGAIGGYGMDEFVSNINNNTNNNSTNNAAMSDANLSPKEIRKFDSKKRWKNWGWKYSPGKTSSIEEEPLSTEVASSTPSAKTSRHSSPTSSPKHKKADKESVTAANVVTQLLNQSPLRRRPQPSTMAAAAMAQGNGSQRSAHGKQSINQSAANANRMDMRSSAGARLCQQFENLDDDTMIDEFQALLINGRPASVHIVPMSSTQLQ